MSIKLLLADDSNVMRPAIVQLLKQEPKIELVGETTNFAGTLQLTAALRPDVLLMDLHMRDEREHPPQLVRSQIFKHTKHILAISVWNDEKAHALADSFGAHVLLDKTKLYSELVPAILQFCQNVSIPKTAKPLEKSFKQAFSPSIEARLDGA
jgi:DNA-binding NarL/FixJ family response regulator